MVISCESGVVIVMRVAEMLLAIVSDGTVPTGLLKQKLRGLSEHLKLPLASMG